MHRVRLLFTAFVLCFLNIVHGSSTHNTIQSDCESDSDLSCAKTVSSHFDQSNRLWIAYVVNDYLWVRHSLDHGQSFSAPIKVNPQAEKISAKGENRPKLLVHKDKVFISWVRPGSKRFTADVRFSRSLDGGKSFSSPRNINTDTLGPEPDIGHSFNVMSFDADHRIMINWLDGRDRKKAQANNEEFRGSSLYQSWSEDWGATFSQEQALSHHSCECCRIAATQNEKAQPVLMWRQIQVEGTRDHVIATIKGKNQLTTAQRVSHENWAVNACPHHGPDLALGDNTQNTGIHAVWFSGAEEKAGLWYDRVSQDLKTKGKAQPFGNLSQQAAHPQIAAFNGLLTRSWQEFDGTKTMIKLQTSHDGGQSWSQTIDAASTMGSADYAFLISDQSGLYIAWHTEKESYRLIPIS